jgi:hypothetical protein
MVGAALSVCTGGFCLGAGRGELPCTVRGHVSRFVFGTSEYGNANEAFLASTAHHWKNMGPRVVIVPPSQWALEGFVAAGVPRSKLLLLPHGFEPSLFRCVHVSQTASSCVTVSPCCRRVGMRGWPMPHAGHCTTSLRLICSPTSAPLSPACYHPNLPTGPDRFPPTIDGRCVGNWGGATAMLSFCTLEP